MNKVRFYKFLVLGLILTNVILISFMFFSKKKGFKRHHRSPREMIIERLEFNAEQAEKYGELITAHKKRMKGHEASIKELKNSLFEKLSDPIQDTILVDSMQIELAELKYNIEKTHYAHFLDIKNICTEEQLPAFKSLSKDMARIFAPHKHGARGPRGPKHKP